MHQSPRTGFMHQESPVSSATRSRPENPPRAGRLQTRLAVRAKAHEFENVRAKQPVDQQIRPEVAVPVILPFAGQLVIHVPAWQRLVRCQAFDDLDQQGVWFLSENT
jgi:hypothetical protein